MKKINLVSLFILGMLLSAAASAAETTELTVTGTIKPGACIPTFAGGNVVDYGVIFAKSLTPGQYKVLEKKQIGLNINCYARTKIAIKLTDNRAASRVFGIVSSVSVSSEEKFNFGLGTVAGQNVGGYALTMDSSTTADDRPVSNIYVTNRTKGAWAISANGLDPINYFSFSQSGTSYPLAVTSVSMKINVQAVLNKPENLPLTQEVPFDGSATFEVIYL